jgi:hypothetical protein
MRLSADTITQSTLPEAYRQQAERPPANETAAVKRVTPAANQSLTLPDDIVTLSTSPEDSPKNMKPSQPVSREEKQALLQPGSSQGGFSVYG